MKRCEKCNQLYAEDFDKCPYCNNTVAKEIKKTVLFAITILFVVLLIVLIMVNKKDNYVISAASMGNKYPYIVKSVRVQCSNDYPNTIYIVDPDKNIYALNGSANIYFTKINPNQKYKGYSTLILKKGMSDTEVMQTGIKLCKD